MTEDQAEMAEAVRQYHVPVCTRPGCLLCVALVRHDRAQEVIPRDYLVEDVQDGLERCARDLALIRAADELILADRGHFLLAGRRLGIDYDTMGAWAGIGHAGVNKALRRARDAAAANGS